MMFLFLSKVVVVLGIVFAMVDSKYLLVDVEEVDSENPNLNELGGKEIAAIKRGKIET